MTKKDIKSIIIFLILFSSTFVYADFTPPLPEPGTATIDGDASEWNLAIDWFSDMWRAGDTQKDILAKCYVRYDCEAPQTLYVLVLVELGEINDTPNENWVDLGSGKLTPINFAYIYNTSGDPIGWEASFSVADGNYPEFEVHALVREEDPDETASTNKIELDLDCETLPVEMTSFSATISGSLAQLNWETATEVNNYGFEVQRSTEIEDWKKVGFVQGHGNSNSPKQYSFTDTEVMRSGIYSYRLKQIDIDGQFEYSDVVNINLDIKDISYELDQNYPNPFNPTTTISYSIPEQTHVDLIIYNLFGEEVARLVNEVKEPGSYTLNYTAENMASGMYFYTIKTDNYSATKKLILMK